MHNYIIPYSNEIQKILKLYHDKSNHNGILSEVIKIKNNSLCRIIKNSPNEIFFKIFSEDEIKSINNIMMESQKNTKVFRNTFELNEKILINDNFKI